MTVAPSSSHDKSAAEAQIHHKFKGCSWQKSVDLMFEDPGLPLWNSEFFDRHYCPCGRREGGSRRFVKPSLRGNSCRFADAMDRLIRHLFFLRTYPPVLQTGGGSAVVSCDRSGDSIRLFED